MQREMQSEIRQWIAENRKKLEGEGLDYGDLDQLEALVENQRPPRIMYLTARSINMRSGIVGWAVFVPGEGPELKLPGRFLCPPVLSGSPLTVHRM